MTHERFEALAGAYGGDVSRWPATEREAAALLMAAEPGFTRGALVRAGEVDMALDAWRAVPASTALADRVIALAPRARPHRWRQWLSPAALSAGLAAACAAGVVVGVEMSNRAAEASEVAVSNTLSAVASLDLGIGA